MNFRKDRFVLWFNPDYYRAMYPDLKKFTNQQLKEHYINYGYYEDRIGSLRQVEYSLSHIDTHFYNEFYKEYEHLKNTRLIMPFPDTLSDDTLETKCLDRTLVIYAFHEYNIYVKMFIKCIFDDKNVDFIMVANNPSFDFLSITNLPPHVKTYTRENSGWDNAAYSLALLKDENYKKYTHFICINSTVVGPYLSSYYPKKWTYVFTDALIDNIHCFGPMINTEKDPLNKSHVQSCCFALTNDAVNYLIDKNIFSNDPKYHASIHDEAIAKKEILMSRLIIERGWNIGCLFPGFKGVDFRFKDKQPEDYGPQRKYLFTGDMMYPKFRYTVWDPYQVVFYKGNRFS
jgi:hypothetical protein